MLGFAHPGTVRTEFMMSVLQLLEFPPCPVQVTHVRGPEISANRNQLTAWFLASDHAWLWMVDADIAFSRLTLYHLLQAADPGTAPVVSALAMTSFDTSPDQFPVMKMARGGSRFDPILNWPKDTLFRVDGIGAACILIHRSVFERIGEQGSGSELWWSDLVIDGRQIGEDLSFCLRAAKASIPVHVHTGIEVGHVKPVMLGRVSL